MQGAINKPGIYQINAKSRLFDIVRKAGGLTPDADVKQMNLAQTLNDQDYIYIPHQGETVSVQGPTSKNDVNTNNQNGSKTDSTSKSSNESTGSTGSQVNINTATQADLQNLNGIGPKRAEQIIAYRDQNGNFASVDDLKNIPGIGDKTLENLKASITVN